VHDLGRDRRRVVDQPGDVVQVERLVREHDLRAQRARRADGGRE
jgi:hypothetical protein